MLFAQDTDFRSFVGLWQRLQRFLWWKSMYLRFGKKLKGTALRIIFKPLQCRLHFKECWINSKKPFMRMIFLFHSLFWCIHPDFLGHDAHYYPSHALTASTRPLMIISKVSSQNPAWVANQPIGRRDGNTQTREQDSEHEQAPDIKIEEPGRVNVSANTSAILLNDDYQRMYLQR